MSEIYSFADEETKVTSEVYEMPRSTANELVLASVLAWVCATDVTARYHPTIFATDVKQL